MVSDSMFLLPIPTKVSPIVSFYCIFSAGVITEECKYHQIKTTNVSTLK